MPVTLVSSDNHHADILIATPDLRQLLQEIDNDLRNPDDLPIVLRPAKCRPAARLGSGWNKTPTG